MGSPESIPDAPGGDDGRRRGRAPLVVLDGSLQDAFGCCHGTLVTWVTARTRDPALAEDIAAEAFERLLVTMRAGCGPADTRAWLRRVALNLVISRARRAHVAERRLGTLIPAIGRADPTLDEVLGRERWAAVLAVLELLPTEQRQVLLMAAVGLGPRHMAATLGTRPGAARTRLHRARQAMRPVGAEESPRP